MHLRSSPTLETLVAFAVVFAGQAAAAIVGVGGPAFALAFPVATRPWTLFTSVYAHGGLWHLVTNAAALLGIGLLVERATTRLRFHAFFLASGVLAGSVQVIVSALLGHPVAVLGASGAIFALLGYLVAGNAATGRVLSRIDASRASQAVGFATVAAAVTLLSLSPRAALVAHFTGLSFGLLAGRIQLLHVRPKRKPQ